MTENVVPFQQRETGETDIASDAAEKALLGAIMYDNRWLDEVDFLRGEHFYWPVHGRIWDACVAMRQRGGAADDITLADHFDGDEQLAAVGGVGYLTDLSASVISPRSAPDYAAKIFDLDRRRRVVSLCMEVSANARTGGNGDSGALIASMEGELYNLASVGREAVEPVNAHDLIAATFDQLRQSADNAGRVIGAPSGLSDLDALLQGALPGQLLIAAARPGMGKSVLGLNWAEAAATIGYQSLFLSLEMDKAQLGMRMLARRTGIQTDAMPWASKDDKKRLGLAGAEIGTLPLRTQTGNRPTVAEIRNRARREQRRHGLDLLVVDYLGLIKPTDPRANRTHQIEEITGGLKELAGELDIPVLALSQLNRDLERRDDKRPTLADLRDSGSIEQDADVVMFIYREYEYLRKAEPEAKANEAEDKFHERLNHWRRRCQETMNAADIIVAKRRMGKTTTIPVTWDGARQEFRDMTPYGRQGGPENQELDL